MWRFLLVGAAAAVGVVAYQAHTRRQEIEHQSLLLLEDMNRGRKQARRARRKVLKARRRELRERLQALESCQQAVPFWSLQERERLAEARELVSAELDEVEQDLAAD